MWTTTLLLAFGHAVAENGQEVMLRVRATSVQPRALVRILYPVGKSWGEITRVRPQTPAAGVQATDPITRGGDASEDTPDIPDENETDLKVFVQEGDTYNYLWLKPGTWSPAVPVATFGGWSLFQAEGLDAGDRKSTVAITCVTLEFELSYAGKVLKTLSASAPDWNRVMVFFPVHLLKGDRGRMKPPEPDFAEGTYGVLEYARRRADALERLPWASGPLPRRYGILSTCSGWKVQTSDPEVFLNEYRALRQMGVNGIYYNTWPGLEAMIRDGTGIGPQFRRIAGNHLGHVCRTGGYIVPGFVNGNVDAAGVAAGVGCPYHPAHAALRDRVRADIEDLMSRLRGSPVEEYWLKTVDEIGSFFDGAAEGKAHQGCCPYCRRAFHEYIRGFGVTLDDFGARSWDEIRSVYGYWAEPWTTQQKGKEAEERTRERRLAGEVKESTETLEQPPADTPDELVGELEKGVPGPKEESVTKTREEQRVPLPERGWSLLHYYSRRFNNDASARIFLPLREVLAEQNAKKRKALAEGRMDSPEAKQPWVYAYALRGNTFLMGGHSLDFFDFYRYADNGFAYETSNRDPRVWQWDSYLCDVGRILQDKLGTRFSVMVKPGRGAIVQRILTAVARNARVIDLYTYGPDWHHPDTFARAFFRLEKLSRTAHMLGEAENVTYEANWALPAEVAVVRPRTSEINETGASHENGKWVYQALTHAHVPADPLDEEFLLSEDLSRYKVIYVSGSHIRRNVAERLMGWVAGGGVLYTSGGGMARDEANQPLGSILPALGLRRRSDPDLWATVRRYGATALPEYGKLKDTPPGCRVVATSLFRGAFDLAVGREVLDPAPESEVLATYSDGQAAAIRHAWGKGFVYVVGFFPGSEYCSDVLRPDFDMASHFSAGKREFVSSVAVACGVRPVVEPSHPLIEGVMLKNLATGKCAVVLMNWAYRGGDLAKMERITVRLRGIGPIRHVLSTWHRQAVPFDQNGEDATVTLSDMEDGDILLVD